MITSENKPFVGQVISRIKCFERKYEEAVTWARKVIELKADYPFYDNLGQVYKIHLR